MPIYAYQCPDCGHDFELLVRLSDPTPECPNCHANNVKKQVTAAGFMLKGGGWYKDGYAAPKPAESKEKKPEAPAKPPTPSSGSGS